MRWSQSDHIGQMISAPTTTRRGWIGFVGEGFHPLPHRHRAISREGTEALPYECTMSLSGTVGAVCDRPRANAVRPYGLAPWSVRIRRGIPSPPEQTPRNLTEGHGPPLRMYNEFERYGRGGLRPPAGERSSPLRFCAARIGLPLEVNFPR